MFFGLVRYLLSILFRSPSEYRIPPGTNVLVIEISKHYIRYFKLKKPDAKQLAIMASSPSSSKKWHDRGGGRSGSGWWSSRSRSSPQQTTLKAITN